AGTGPGRRLFHRLRKGPTCCHAQPGPQTGRCRYDHMRENDNPSPGRRTRNVTACRSAYGPVAFSPYGLSAYGMDFAIDQAIDRRSVDNLLMSDLFRKYG